MKEWEEMLSIPGPDLAIEVERTPEVWDPNRTLSEEGFNTLKSSMALWVGSRMMRSMNDGVVPQKVTVHILVALDGELAK